jgi:agmatinase
MSDFGGAVRKQDTYDLAVFGIPYDAKSSYLKGAASGPSAIRSASSGDRINAFTELGADLSRDAVLVDLGDVEVSGEFEQVSGRIEAKLGEVLDHSAVPLILGGDHSVTYPIVRALVGVYPSLDILHFDAHPDLYDQYQGDPYSHACPFARILEEGLAAGLVQVGIRAANAAHRARAESFDVRMLEMKDLEDDLALSFRRPLYISFDIDVLDPAFAPGVSHLEPGGMTTRQALGILHRLEADIVVERDKT